MDPLPTSPASAHPTPGARWAALRLFGECEDGVEAQFGEWFAAFELWRGNNHDDAVLRAALDALRRLCDAYRLARQNSQTERCAVLHNLLVDTGTALSALTSTPPAA
jgi:hypothetical protein